MGEVEQLLWASLTFPVPSRSPVTAVGVAQVKGRYGACDVELQLVSRFACRGQQSASSLSCSAVQ